ncbi:transposase A [Bacillus thuringiensis Bt18247]|uniref:Transposase A n=1 Tax=Bacillus thuringiensis Bt18247 TaxID=1423143 RepID=A0A9W3XBC6_BACTU|nr:transposase A [Bacillus thuringiensis Bt18247]
MRVQEVILEQEKRYMLIDDEGIPVLVVMKYLKYLDTTGKSSNTQKTYCYALKQYFTYLKEAKKGYKEIQFADLVEFVAWLRNPYESIKVKSIQSVKARRTEKTVNLTITVVTNFYDFLYRTEELSKDMNEKLMRQVFTNGNTRYKGFLHHINKNKLAVRNVLKVKEPRKKIQVLTKDEVEKLCPRPSNTPPANNVPANKIRIDMILSRLGKVRFAIASIMTPIQVN